MIVVFLENCELFSKFMNTWNVIILDVYNDFFKILGT